MVLHHKGSKNGDTKNMRSHFAHSQSDTPVIQDENCLPQKGTDKRAALDSKAALVLFLRRSCLERFELPTSWFVAMRSIQLGYRHRERNSYYHRPPTDQACLDANNIESYRISIILAISRTGAGLSRSQTGLNYRRVFCSNARYCP